MGMTAEILAEKFDISREEQDRFACASQQKAVAAIDSGRFAREIVPVSVPKGKKESVLFETDEFPRRDATIEKLQVLKPAFMKDGTVTAGNSSGRNDGASALLLASGQAAKKYGLKPIARVIAYASAGVDPRTMGIGPVPATRKALKKCGLNLEGIGLIEINEAFAAQTLACVKELGIDQAKLNVNALLFPLGMSGARILTTLTHEMDERAVRYGLATICVAGGLGMSVVCEKI